MRCNIAQAFAALALTAVMTVAAAAPTTVEVIKTGATKSAIDLQGLQAPAGGAAEFKKVLEADLEFSGWFNVVRQGTAPIVVDGSCIEAEGSLGIRLRVRNTTTAKVFLETSRNAAAADVRRTAHKLADEIVEAVKGCRGIASTRIVMIGSSSGSKELWVCDADGQNLKQLTHDRSISVAPTWTRDAGAILYTSFRTTFPYIYRIDTEASPPTRRRITNFAGLNLCAAVSPDGRQMALSLSKDGNPELYVMDFRSEKVTRVTKTRDWAETSPSWSPDGKEIVFVSDRSGRPDIYIADRDGGDARHALASSGFENVCPDWGPNGLIVFSSKRGGRYQLCVLDPSAGSTEQLTDAPADHEDPSWAPDGRHIVFSHTVGYRSNIYILDTMGGSTVRLTRGIGDWFSPAWSPK